MSHPHAIVMANLTFAHPGTEPLLRDVSAAFSPGRTGLVGRNGCGKTTLLRLIAGELAPTSGTIQAAGDVGNLPQNLTLRADATLADLLGIAPIMAAIAAIERGEVDAAHFETIGDDWDIAERATARLASVVGALNSPADLARPVRTLSGGEAILSALVGLELNRTPIVLLDEPTNNLDRDARERLYALVRTWRGTLVVVSHDVELLDLMDTTAELREGTLRTFRGGYTAFAEALAAEQDAARQAVRTAEQRVRAEKRQRAQAATRIARSARQGKARATKGESHAAMDWRANRAEKAQGASGVQAAARVEQAHEALAEAELLVRDDDQLRLDLPDPGLPAGRRLAELRGTNRTIIVAGPQRIALVGGNGVGKTTLLESLVTGAASRLPASGVALSGRLGYLPQRLDALADEASVLAAVGARAPHVPEPELRNRLSRFLFTGDMVHRRIGELSGGERFRAVLATLLLADPPPELLVLDEPTNNLDLASVDQLVAALTSYRGALLIVSHDHRFLGRLRLDLTLELTPDGELVEREVPAS